MAIGATRRDISRLFLLEATKLTLAGTAAGLVIAWFVTQPLAMFLVPGLKSTDPVNYAAVLLMMLAVALLATAFPLRKAAGIDPNLALRYE
jgi:ABC-type antimicrobial peptide transport system permease subunit